MRVLDGSKSSIVSIHALLAESDNTASITPTASRSFYPRSPCGERRRKAFSIFLPIRVSIHALLAESDLTSLFRPVKEQSFYPRSPCGERHTGQPVRGLPSCFYPRSPCGERLAAGTVCRQMQGFLSTLSLRRATQPPPLLIVELTSFYPRSPCGERHAKPWRKYHTADVSIHALLAESDARGPLRARAPEVSIHALLAESDAEAKRTTDIRPPFLSTLSLRRATCLSICR